MPTTPYIVHNAYNPYIVYNAYIVHNAYNSYIAYNAFVAYLARGHGHLNLHGGVLGAGEDLDCCGHFCFRRYSTNFKFYVRI